MMKMLIASSLLLAALPCLAITSSASGNTPNYCSQLSGVWEGHYQDPTGLFPKKNFPIKLALQSHNEAFYGYTLKSADDKAAKFGKQAWLIWGNCSNNLITRLYFINPNNKPVCGDPAQKMSPLLHSHSLFLYIPWENAMTGTTFNANLTRISTKFEVNQGLLDEARQLSKTQISTCH